MRLLSFSGVAFAASLLFATAIAVPAAHSDPRGGGRIVGYVTATSDFHSGSVTGPVRRGRLGLQVRLPGGTWLYCERSCAQTLRDQTLDFWKQFENRGGD